MRGVWAPAHLAFQSTHTHTGLLVSNANTEIRNKETKIDKEVETRFDQFAVFVQTSDVHQPKVIPNYILFFSKQNTNVFSSALSCLLWLLNVKEGLWLLKG